MDQTDTILASAYPSVYRIAAGLSGRKDVAEGIVGFVFRAAVRETAGWQRLEEPIKWFWHYTVLTSRRVKKKYVAGRGDLLIPAESAGDRVYVVFVATLRALHQQQAEAFILRFGENLDPRQLAVAMDCSVTAAANHLEAAVHALTAAVGPTAMTACTATLARAYAGLTPPAELHLRSMKKMLRKQGWSRVMRTAGAVLAAAALAAACLWGVYLLSK